MSCRPWRDFGATNKPQPSHPWRGVRRAMLPFKATSLYPANPPAIKAAA